MRSALILVASLLMAGCDGGRSGTNPLSLTDASVAGAWEISYINGSSARFLDCDGSLELNHLDGSLVAPPDDSDPFGCSADDSFVVSQSVDEWRASSEFYTCDDGLELEVRGQGFVDGASVSGHLLSSIRFGNVTIHDRLRISGYAAADTILLTADLYTVTGSISGSCRISPPLKLSVAVGEI